MGTLLKGVTLIERESRMPQIQSVKGEAVPPLAGLRTLDNAEGGVSSAFPQGKQNRDKIAEFISH